MEKSKDSETNIEEDSEGKIINGSVSDNEIDPKSASASKRRGRKRKSVESEKITCGTPVQDEEVLSRKGRRRKSVNYFALANPDLDDVVGKKIPKLEDDSPEGELASHKNVKNTRKRSSMRNKVIKEENQNIEAKNLVTVSTDIEAVGNAGESSQYSNMDDLAKQETNVDVDENKTTNNSNTKNSDKTGDSKVPTKKGKIYRKTGNTTHLINTLLSQADFNKTVLDTDRVSKSSIKRGRPSTKKKKTKDEKKYEDTGENIFADHKTVTCAVCKKELEKNHWPHHKQRYHNNLAWRVGEPALDSNDIDLVKYILNALYVAKKPFHCDICDKSVKSVNGYLSHKSVCGKETEDVKVACEICGRKMLPVSIPPHIRLSHEVRDNVEMVVEKKPSTETGGKRRAAEKALKVIKNFNLETSLINTTFSNYFEDLSFMSSDEAISILQDQIESSNRVECKYPDCNFECFTGTDIKNHLKFCVKKPENGYVCKYCLLVQSNIADIIYHIETLHKILIEVEKKSEENPGDIEKSGKRNLKQNINKKTSSGEKDKPQKKWPAYLLPADRNVDVIFRKAYEWTLQFCENNYSTVLPEEHFSCLKSDWDYMDSDRVEEYLPQMPYSCDVGFETVAGFQDVLHKDHTFRRFELFEAYLENNGNSTIFCGGPITALSWMPTPHGRGGFHQIVAVATKPNPDAQYVTDVNYNEKCFIQFWDVGPLKNTDTSLFRPKQAFCLQFDHGPVWDLQWCPSSCFDLSEQSDDSKKLRRMGVLAVAGSDSYVYIYSIPYFKENGQFYHARPSLVLIRNVFEKEKLGDKEYYATRMSWTKAAGHKYLAVGYSNGQVAMYNLWSNSELLRCKSDNNIDVSTPYMVLDAHCHSVTAIALHHSHDGCKWSMTGSYDRTVRTWDLEERSCVRTLKGNIVNDAVWMTHWMSHIIGYDEASTIGNACSAIHQCKEGASDPLYSFHCSSAITSLSTSDWLNGIIQANSVGEIFATFPKQLALNLNWKNMKNKKLLCGYTTLVEKNKTIEERSKVNSEKQKALRNKLKIKTKISARELPSNRDVMHLDYNPHYFEYEPLVYHEMDEKYGLIFCDHKMNKWSDFPPKLQEQMSHTSEKYSPSRPNMYPSQSITKIQFNMNRQASTYYVSGYQAGFIRLTYSKFSDQDPQVLNDSENMK